MSAPYKVLFSLSHGRAWGLGVRNGDLILLKSRMLPIDGQRKNGRFWHPFPTPYDVITLNTKTDVFHVLIQENIRLTSHAQDELNDLPEQFSD